MQPRSRVRGHGTGWGEGAHGRLTTRKWCNPSADATKDAVIDLDGDDSGRAAADAAAERVRVGTLHSAWPGSPLAYRLTQHLRAQSVVQDDTEMEMDVDDVGSRPANVGVGAVTALDGEHLMALLLQVTKRGLNLGEQPDLCDRLFEVVGTVLDESRKPATGAVRYGTSTGQGRKTSNNVLIAVCPPARPPERRLKGLWSVSPHLPWSC